MSCGGSEKNRWFQLDVLISMLWSSSCSFCFLFSTVIIGTVRGKVSTHGQLTSLVVELMKVYKGGALTLRRSRFFQEPLLIVKNRYQETRQCQNQCFGDIEGMSNYSRPLDKLVCWNWDLRRCPKHSTVSTIITPGLWALNHSLNHLCSLGSIQPLLPK